MHSLLNKTFSLNINMRGGGDKEKKVKKIKSRDQTSRDKLHGLAFREYNVLPTKDLVVILNSSNYWPCTPVQV